MAAGRGSGRVDWVAEIAAGPAALGRARPSRSTGGPCRRFAVAETLRPGRTRGGGGAARRRARVEILSGDAAEPVERIAARARHRRRPLRCRPRPTRSPASRRCDAAGHRVLMVGDGLNDTPRLGGRARLDGARHRRPTPAAPAADFVFTARAARRGGAGARHRAARRRGWSGRTSASLLVYNCVAIPLAVAGLVTPLIAALAMSASSILVVANALRLNRAGRGAARLRPPAAEPATAVPA